MSRFARVSAVFCLAAIIASGCAKERPPRSYVQPNIIAKADLTGEWYYVPTVIDLNMGHSVTFVGEAGWNVSIIKWDIQERVLYARLAYERIDNTDAVYNDPNFKGEVIGAWAIESQFDIIRDYNATTGEETNVIRETTERPWYEREFIRVNWAENLVSNWEGLLWQRAVTTDPISYVITDPKHPHAPRMERNEDGDAEFINIVNKVLVTPQMRSIDFDFMGLTRIPDCFFYGSLSSCTSTEVTIRHAFWRKNPDHEYEKLEWTQREQDDFGYFLAQRLYYDDDYGVTIQGIRWYINRFNLWKESFEKAYTVQEAEIFKGQCDVPVDRHGEPIEGATVYYCPGDGDPCRCIVDNKKIFIQSEKAYRYSDLERATPEEAAVYARAQCRGGNYSCAADGCFCSEGNQPVYKLAHRLYDMPQEHLGRDGIVCPCDNPQTSQWDCGKEEEFLHVPLPACFYKIDGAEVHFATSQGKQKYPLRYHQRELRTIPYYLNKEMPEDIKVRSHAVVRQWADVFDDMVWRMSGCEAAGLVRGEDRCEARPEYDPQAAESFHTFITCHNNPVQEGDPEACGPAGREVLPGDIRYSYIQWWKPPQLWAPLGYGPPLADPLTGETISAISNLYGAAMDSYTVYARDLVRMMTDEDFQWIDYMHGYYQGEFVRKMQYELGLRESSKSVAPPRKRSWEKKRWSADDVKALYQNMDMGWTKAIQSRVKPDFSTPAKIRQYMAAQARVITDSGVFGNRTRPDRARMNLLRNSYVEDMMMTNDMLLNRTPTLVAAGYSPQHILNMTGADIGGAELRHKVSPLTWMNVNYIRAMEEIKFSHFANTHMYAEFVPFSEPSTLGLAQELVRYHCGCAITETNPNCEDVDMDLTERWASDPMCGEKIKKDLRLRIYDPVAVHEMGHNIGLRHNFRGSFDAMNYKDEYWDLRVESAKMQGEPILERYQQPRTEWENMNKIADYQWASIMDYGAKFNSDFVGLGKWDIAAVNYGYGRQVEVFDSINPHIDDAQSTLATIQNFRSFSWPTPVRFYRVGPEAILSNRLHYDPENFAQTPEGVVDVRDRNRQWRPRSWIVPMRLGGSSPTLVSYNNLEEDGRARIMVPYKFCADEFRNSALGCNYFDEGADLFEITENQIQAYENYYVFNNWGRDSYTWGWNEDSYLRRIWGRYFNILQNHMQYYGLYRAIMENDYFEDDPGNIDRFFTEDWAHYTISVARGFETFARVLNMPAPGYYGCGIDAVERTAPDGVSYWKQDLETHWCNLDGGCLGNPAMGMCALHVDILDGKYWEDRWDFDLGYQWFLKRLRYGQFYDRPLAMQALAEATNYFMGRDTQEDFRLYTINYTRLYPTQILELMGAIQSNDLTVSAPRLCRDDQTGEYHIEHVNFSRLDLEPCEEMAEQMGRPMTFEDTYLDPGHTFTTQLYTAVFGMTMFPMTYSQEFIDAWRVFVKGSVEGHDFDHCIDVETDGCELVTFTDPISHKSFQSVRYPDRERVERVYDVSIGARIIEYANLLKDNYEEALSQCGDPCEPANPAYNRFFRTRQQLKDYVINLEMIRTLTYTFDHPEYAGGVVRGTGY